MSQIIGQDACSFCGACMAACPINILWPVDERPTMVGTCILCEICYNQCPNVEFSNHDVEYFIHGRRRKAEETVGIYRQAFVGRAGYSDISSRGQDGGVVTALLAYALESKLIDAAVVAGRDAKWLARPKVATKYEDVIQGAGTKYTPSPTILGVRSAIDDYGKSRVGLVGTPCQIRAVRRIQTSPLGNRRLAQAMTLSIGLFCMESYKYDSLMENYIISKGIDPTRLTKVEIKKGQFVVSSGETEVLRVPLKDLNQFVRGCCHQCDDFTAEYADVSVGGIGCPSGYSSIIARTHVGLELLMAAARAGYVELRELKQEDKGFQRILNMSQMKKARKTVQKIT
ncbi:MAG: Coenzyme F420 hydrogenase/dehydrogenase, beta subunit C-terminal domain [Candidatus Bathyarchaeia archaeon]